MSYIKNLAIEHQLDAIEITTQIEQLQKSIREYESKYKRLLISENSNFTQGKKALRSRLYINTSIVSFIEIRAKQLIVQLL